MARLHTGRNSGGQRTQTKMLVRCQRFGDWFLFGLVWQYSLIQKNIIKVGAKSWMLTCSYHMTLSLPFYTDPDSKRELNFCNGYLSLLYFWLRGFVRKWRGCRQKFCHKICQDPAIGLGFAMIRIKQWKPVETLSDLIGTSRGATGAAGAPKPGKTPIMAARRSCRRRLLLFKIKVRPWPCRPYRVRRRWQGFETQVIRQKLVL